MPIMTTNVVKAAAAVVAEKYPTTTAAELEQHIEAVQVRCGLTRATTLRELTGYDDSVVTDGERRQYRALAERMTRREPTAQRVLDSYSKLSAVESAISKGDTDKSLTAEGAWIAWLGSERDEPRRYLEVRYSADAALPVSQYLEKHAGDQDGQLVARAVRITDAAGRL